VTDRREPAAHPIRELLAYWDGLYQANVGARYPFSGGKEAKLVKDLREMFSDEDIRTYMAAFFEVPDAFIEQSGYSFSAFRGCLPKVIAFAKGRQVRKPVMSEAAASVFRVIGGKAS
jgi:hypothetical protein